jgi:hypothetical protein
MDRMTTNHSLGVSVVQRPGSHLDDCDTYEGLKHCKVCGWAIETGTCCDMHKEQEEENND